MYRPVLTWTIDSQSFLLTIAVLWISSIQNLFKKETSQNDEFSVQNVFEKRCISFVYRMARSKQFYYFFHDQERPEKNQNYRMPKRMVVGVCWQAWQNYCGSGGSKLRSADEENLREERAARVNAKRLAAVWQRYIYQWRTQSVTRASVELLEMAEGLRAADRDLTEALRVAE